MAQGVIHWGIQNIFGVWSDGRIWECRLKGKTLKDSEGEYNPLAPGDCVEWEPSDSGLGMIHSRHNRRNAYSRWNKKRSQPQTLAANLDQIVLVTSPLSPPFRPRFLDRALLMAQVEHLDALILVNKCDQALDSEVEDRLATYQSLGWDVHLCSAKTGEGLAELQEHLAGSVCALVGQSGVGKSTVLNALMPAATQRTGELSAKYDRGNHTTNFSLYFPWNEGGGLVDTPGVRELEIFGIKPNELSFYFPEFDPLRSHCGFSSCTHRGEPNCAVRQGVEAGEIHPDRWDSYVKLYEELLLAEKAWT